MEKTIAPLHSKEIVAVICVVVGMFFAIIQFINSTVSDTEKRVIDAIEKVDQKVDAHIQYHLKDKQCITCSKRLVSTNGENHE